MRCPRGAFPRMPRAAAPGCKSDEITQVLCHLRLMDNIRDDLSLLACLRSPALGLTDEELAQIRIRTPGGSYLEARAPRGGRATTRFPCAARTRCRELEHERFLMRSMPLPEYLWKWLSRSGLYAFYGCQPYGRLRQANLRLLCEKAVEFQARGGGDLKAFLQRRRIRGPPCAKVRKPHGARPAGRRGARDVHPQIQGAGISRGVFDGAGNAPFERRGAGELSSCTRGSAWRCPYVDEMLRVKGDTLLSAAIGLRLEERNLAERARVLYVGMTRARDELILMGCADAPRFTAARPSAYAVASAKHMLEWLLLLRRSRGG